MYDFSRLNGISRDLISGGASSDEVLQALRDAGAGPVHSMKVLCDTTGIGLAEAKVIVWSSSVWADQRDAHVRLVDDLVEELGH